MKFRILLWLCIVALGAYGLYAAESLLQQRQLAEKTIRLHVVANSDSADDQAQKLRVRDAVLKEVSRLTSCCTDAEQAKQVLSDNLMLLTDAAQEVLAAENSSYTAEVALTTEGFDTRYYDTFTLPAGEYPSLRVKIGAARGKNWWCVVFPSLCTAATSDAVEQCAEVGGYDSGETQLITGGEEEYTIRFKTLEWLQKITDWFK